MGDTTRQIGGAAVWSVTARAGRFLLGMASTLRIDPGQIPVKTNIMNRPFWTSKREPVG